MQSSPAAVRLAILAVALLWLSGCDADSSPTELPEATIELYDMKLTPVQGTPSEALSTSVWLRVSPWHPVVSVKLVASGNGKEVTLTTSRTQDAKGTTQLTYSETKISLVQDQLASAKSITFRWRALDQDGVQRSVAEQTLLVVPAEGELALSGH